MAVTTRRQYTIRSAKELKFCEHELTDVGQSVYRSQVEKYASDNDFQDFKIIWMSLNRRWKVETFHSSFIASCTTYTNVCQIYSAAKMTRSFYEGLQRFNTKSALKDTETWGGAAKKGSFG